MSVLYEGLTLQLGSPVQNSRQKPCRATPLSRRDVAAKEGAMTSKSLTYAPYIDGLRAVAVLSVMAYHLNGAFLPGGFTGVDVFFVISGFVVAAAAADAGTLSVRGFLAWFYGRRLFRIAPALIVCLLVTTLAFTMLIPSALMSDAIQKAGTAAFFGLSNFALVKSNNDYFAPLASLNPFTHTWSLAVEEQFYLVAPAIFILWARGRRGLAVAVTVAALVASMLCAWWLGRGQPVLAFYMIYSRFWELAAGVLLFQMLALTGHPFGGARPASWVATGGATLAAAALAVGLATATPNSTPFPGGILPVLGTLGLLGFLQGRPSGGPLLAALTLPPVRYVGKISYSLYLWHWPVYVLFRWTAGLEDWPCYAAALAVTFALAACSYHFVEGPPRRRLARWPYARHMAVWAGLLALLAGYGIATGIFALRPVISVSTVQRHYSDWWPYGSSTDPAFPGCKITATHTPLAVEAFSTFTRTGCDDKVTFPHQVFVIGDSHAAGYLELLKKLTMQTGAVAQLYYVPRCPFIGLETPTSGNCAAFNRAAAADVIARVRPHDVVFLPSLRLSFGDYTQAPGMAAQNLAAGEAEALPILQKLSTAGADVVFEAPTPFFASPAYRCADWIDHANPLCHGSTVKRKDLEAERAGILAAYAKFQALVPNVYVWDPASVLCGADECSEFANGRPLFYDDNHLSGYGNIFLLPSFKAFIFALENGH
jgi:peptidoglycan/LPS O-acetylase OafA/YrhL